MNEIKFKPVDSAVQEILPLGYEWESGFVVKEPSYMIKINFVNLKKIVSGLNFSTYSQFNPQTDPIIKYSKEEFSPVSSKPSDYIQLASPSYYRKMVPNSELIADDLEAIYVESFNSESFNSSSHQSVIMKNLSDNFTAPPFNLIDRLNLKIKLCFDLFWMYCTSIDPQVNVRRKLKVRHFSSDYNFITKIEKPSSFAEQVGRDLGKQVMEHKDLKYYFPIIEVSHGPVVYLDKVSLSYAMRNYRQENYGKIVPFIKRRKYESQQEYRFIVSANFHNPDKDTFYLKVSDDLRSLMSPIEGI